MKKHISLVLVLILFISIFTIKQDIYASQKSTESRSIAIVFDNSGSMYSRENKAWSRATYAMEVFASMLNENDTLSIYPMHPIEINGKSYTMDKPYEISDSSQANTIRNIYTPFASGTPIESIDYAANGLKDDNANKKYLLILTDGGTFSKNGYDLGSSGTKKELAKRVSQYSGDAMTMMYLGIGSGACMPDENQTEYFIKKKAESSESVLATLTEMCNLIFGRDTLPEKNITGNNISFDLSMKKLIVFVQGDSISDLKVVTKSGEPIGNLISTQQTLFASKGSGNYDSIPDKSLQGMIVTYLNCGAGEYVIQYTGNASNIEAYYEPNADLDFVFTDSQGNNVDYNALYEGEYKVSFGMKDAVTGKLINSSLLGKPEYKGSYIVNGKEVPFSHNGYSGEVPIALKMNDSFSAKLTVTYLSGYVITKDSTDFGWPETGIKIAARPAGNLTIEISGGEKEHPLQKLNETSSYKVKIYYEGKQLVGEELKKVSLNWDEATSNAKIQKDIKDDCIELSLAHKNPEKPGETVCGECSVNINASYTAEGSAAAKAIAPFKYNIKNDFKPLKVELFVPEDYIVIKDLDNKTIGIKLTVGGKALTPEEFKRVTIEIDCSKIAYSVEPNSDNSEYVLRLKKTEGIKEGDYQISVSASYVDEIERSNKVDVSTEITLSNIARWLKFLIGLFLLLFLIFIVIVILHIKVLPKKAHVTKRDSTMIFDGEEETRSTTFDCKIKKNQMSIHSKYAGIKTGLMMDVKPGKDSYLKKTYSRRSVEVKSSSVKKTGSAAATIQEASLGGVRFIINEETGKIERFPKNDKPFTLRHGTPVTFSGTIFNAGVHKPFIVNTKLNFKKR